MKKVLVLVALVLAGVVQALASDPPAAAAGPLLVCPAAGQAGTMLRARVDQLPADAECFWAYDPPAAAELVRTGPDSVVLVGREGAGQLSVTVVRWAARGPAEPLVLRQRVTLAPYSGGSPSPDPIPTPPNLDPHKAIVPIVFGNAGCTATILSPRKADGRWQLLSASHCIAGVGSTGSARLADGRTVRLHCVAWSNVPDLSWLETDDAGLGELPSAQLATTDPKVGDAVWQAGYGTNQPGVTKAGQVVALADGEGQMEFFLSVSHGDSGGPIFHKASGRVLAAVCCTTRIAGDGQVWAGGWAAAAALRPRPVAGPPAARPERIHPILIYGAHGTGEGKPPKLH